MLHQNTKLMLLLILLVPGSSVPPFILLEKWDGVKTAITSKNIEAINLTVIKIGTNFLDISIAIGFFLSNQQKSNNLPNA